MRLAVGLRLKTLEFIGSRRRRAFDDRVGDALLFERAAPKRKAAILQEIAACTIPESRAYLPTMNTQLVVPLPPIFSMANFFAPSTW